MSQAAFRDAATVASGLDTRLSAATGTASNGRAGALAGIEFDVISSLAGLETIEADWNELHRSSARPHQVFQTFNWCWHWCRHYLADNPAGPTLAVVTGRRAGRLVLVMPLAVQRRVGLTELSWLGEPVSQYGDVLATQDASRVEILLDAWRVAVSRTRADVANLRRVRADSVAAPLLEAIGATVTASEEAPYLDLAGETDFPGWEDRRKPKARTNRRRQARRLAESGPVDFVALAGTPEAGALAAHAVRLKRATLGAKGAFSPALADERFEAFFADVAAARTRPAGVTVLTITSNGEPIALKILLESEAAAFLHVAVFEPGFEKRGAGSLLLQHLVERTINARRGTLDLLPPRHDYKMDLGDGVVAVNDHALAVSAAGWIYTQGYLRLRRKLKGAIEGLPRPVRRVIARLVG